MKEAKTLNDFFWLSYQQRIGKLKEGVIYYDNGELLGKRKNGGK